ncbi:MULTISPECIES: ABC transporter permease [unclassified Micromonospora]|uniref:ABC transporter permease n=1 Tax=unclassified Micromonospora TaxID=2617518 RepID=UPI00104E3F21|nr:MULTISPECIES: ABC transporter permease [unclassified Micromonospora]TDB77229.1 ABC transporter permease [Micromonospora sp. KC721]TDC29751.1 ABC transporter permease [Micromonospora sp. KC213]
MTAGVAALWSHRNSLRILVKRDLAVKYQQSVLGYLWSLIEPLGMGAIYFFVFGVLYSGDTSRHLGQAADSYPLFLITGIFAWMWTSSALSEATGALTGQSRLITTMNVPRQVFPIGRVTGRFAEYVAGLPILVAVAAVYAAHGRIDPGWSLLALPLAVLVQATLLIGLSLLLSAVNVLMRDVERFMRLIVRVLFYATPIIYPLSLVRDSELPGWLKVAYELNPLVGIFQLQHAIWYPDEFPDARLLTTTVGGSVLVLVAGWWTFRRLEPAVLKEL